MSMKLMAILCGAGLIVGCDRSSSSNHPPPATKPPPAHKEGGGHTEHGGEIIELGSAPIGDLTVRASRDKGDLRAGGDAPIDVWVTTSDGKPATVAIVRFWIGTADAKGSIKAKADIEDPKQPNHWHTHAEVPAPLPPDAKLWVEVEEKQNTKAKASFDLKQ